MTREKDRPSGSQWILVGDVYLFMSAFQKVPDKFPIPRVIELYTGVNFYTPVIAFL